MQEEVNQKTMALSIRASKLTGKVLAAALPSDDEDEADESRADER